MTNLILGLIMGLIMIGVFTFGFFVVKHYGEFMDETYKDKYCRPHPKKEKNINHLL